MKKKWSNHELFEADVPVVVVICYTKHLLDFRLVDLKERTTFETRKSKPNISPWRELQSKTTVTILTHPYMKFISRTLKKEQNIFPSFDTNLRRQCQTKF